MKTFILSMLLVLMAGSAVADKPPPKPYEEQPKYAKMLCVLAGIPVKYCHRKEK